MGFSALCTAIIPVPANHHSGPSSKGSIRQHDIECPPGKGWARALASGYMRNPATMASIHYIVDAGDTVGTLDEDFWAWGSGTPSSQHGIHIEQAGYASFTRGQWLGDPSAIGATYVRPDGSRWTYTAQDAADMAAQIERLAQLWADICGRYGWEPVWATDDQIRAECAGVDTGAHYTHRRATDVVGGTTHRDPGDGYPTDRLVARVSQIMHGPTPPTPPVPDDLWEWIMTLPDAPTTWAQACKDIANAVVLAGSDYDLPADPVKAKAIPRTVERAFQVARNRINHGANFDNSRRPR